MKTIIVLAVMLFNLSPFSAYSHSWHDGAVEVIQLSSRINFPENIIEVYMYKTKGMFGVEKHYFHYHDNIGFEMNWRLTPQSYKAVKNSIGTDHCMRVYFMVADAYLDICFN